MSLSVSLTHTYYSQVYMFALCVFPVPLGACVYDFGSVYVWVLGVYFFVRAYARANTNARPPYTSQSVKHMLLYQSCLHIGWFRCCLGEAFHQAAEYIHRQM